VAELIHIPHSPWSERARWALDHHRIAYDASVYVPMLCEPVFRLRLGLRAGRITAPMLFDGDEVLRDSYDIARHAEAHGRGAPLFPEECVRAIDDWHRRAEAAAHAGRALMARKLAADGDAKLEAVPAAIPAPLRAALRPMADVGVSFFSRKYRLSERTEDTDRRALGQFLSHVRDQLSGRDTLLDRFTFADVSAATVLQLVLPVADEYISLGRATRACWTDPQLADQFCDLLDWRDALYARYR